MHFHGAAPDDWTGRTGRRWFLRRVPSWSSARAVGRLAILRSALPFNLTMLQATRLIDPGHTPSAIADRQTQATLVLLVA